MKRTAFIPKMGTIYRNHGGGTFECVDIRTYRRSERVTMQNTASGWTFTAHGCGIYEDGTIDWDYSTDGHFERIER